MLRHFLIVMGSQAAQLIVTLLGLPVLAGNLGPEDYGEVSLFLLLANGIVCLDFARPLLVREFVGDAQEQPACTFWLTTLNGLYLAVIAVVAGAFLFQAATLAGLCATVALFCCGSADFAWIAANEGVGRATMVRNLAWAAAYAAVVAMSFLPQTGAWFCWPFAAANLLLLVVYRRWSERTASEAKLSQARIVLAPYWGKIRDVVVSSLATVVTTSLDRVLLRQFASPEDFGRYSAHMDLAMKVNAVSATIGAVAYPSLSRQHQHAGPEAAAQSFVRLLSSLFVGCFFVAMTLIVASPVIVRTFLGEQYSTGVNYFALFACGAFIQLLGHLLTVWQRAQNDFATPRVAYVTSAGLVVGAGLSLVRLVPMTGALITHLCGRWADFVMLFKEANRLRGGLRPWTRATVAVALILITASTAIWRSGLVAGDSKPINHVAALPQERK